MLQQCYIDCTETVNCFCLILRISLNTLPLLGVRFSFSNNLKKVITRNRYEFPLSVFLYGNNANENYDNRLYKVQ